MFKRFWAYFGPYKKYLVISSVCVVLEGTFELVIPLIMADIIDVGVAARDTGYILGKGLQMVFAPWFPALGAVYAVWPPWPARASVTSCAGRNTRRCKAFPFPTSIGSAPRRWSPG